MLVDAVQCADTDGRLFYQPVILASAQTGQVRVDLGRVPGRPASVDGFQRAGSAISFGITTSIHLVRPIAYYSCLLRCASHELANCIGRSSRAMQDGLERNQNQASSA